MGKETGEIATAIVVAWLGHHTLSVGPAASLETFAGVGAKIGAVYKEVHKAVREADDRKGDTGISIG